MDLNNLLRTLNEEEKFSEKNEILEIMDLLRDSLNKSLDVYRQDGAKAGAALDIEALKQIKKTSDVIESVIEEIDTLQVYKTDSKPSSISISDNTNTVKEGLVVIDLISNLTNTKPKQVMIENDVIDNNAGTWTNMLYILASYFANKFPTRFCEYVKVVNSKRLEGYRYADNEPTNKNYFYIKNVKKYLIYHGSANDIGKSIDEMIKYFNYSNKCIVYGIKNAVIIVNNKVQENPDLSEYKVNDYINHTSYGIGRITNIDESKQYVTIRFSKEGEKVFPFNQVNKEHFIPMTNRHFN